MNEVVLGLDLSCSGLGMCAVPIGWDLDWSRVRFRTLSSSLEKGASPREHALRCRGLAIDVVTWARWVGATRLWIEALPGFVPKETMHAFRKNAGLHMAVLLEFIAQAFGLDPSYIDEMSARKFLLGAVPQTDRKAVVRDALTRAGAPFEDGDQCDAFVVANWGLSELDAPCLSGLMLSR